jgi:hypothetical protein
VSKAETIAKLHKLLERIRQRAGSRTAHEPAMIASAAPHVEEAAPYAEDETVQMSTWTPPPPEDPTLAIEVDYVETTAVTITTDASIEEPAGGFDSSERLVTAAPAEIDASADDPVEVGEASLEAEAPAVVGVVAYEDDLGESQPLPSEAEDELLENPPASSRRPVAAEPEERLEQMAFGRDDARPPLHTPPPESGRLPTAPAGVFDSDAPASDGAELEPRITADVVRVPLESSLSVAHVTGVVTKPMPATFSALLDDALSL